MFKNFECVFLNSDTRMVIAHILLPNICEISDAVGRSNLRKLRRKWVQHSGTRNFLTPEEKPLSSTVKYGFILEKYTADPLKKIKCRFVAGGHLQDRDVNGTLSTGSTSNKFITN